MACRGGRWSTTSERFYYVAWAFYCFATEKAAVLEDDGLFLSSAAALLEKTLFTKTWAPGLRAGVAAMGTEHEKC